MQSLIRSRFELETFCGHQSTASVLDRCDNQLRHRTNIHLFLWVHSRTDCHSRTPKTWPWTFTFLNGEVNGPGGCDTAFQRRCAEVPDKAWCIDNFKAPLSSQARTNIEAGVPAWSGGHTTSKQLNRITLNPLIDNTFTQVSDGKHRIRTRLIYWTNPTSKIWKVVLEIQICFCLRRIQFKFGLLEILSGCRMGFLRCVESSMKHRSFYAPYDHFIWSTVR